MKAKKSQHAETNAEDIAGNARDREMGRAGQPLGDRGQGSHTWDPPAGEQGISNRPDDTAPRDDDGALSADDEDEDDDEFDDDEDADEEEEETDSEDRSGNDPEAG